MSILKTLEAIEEILDSDVALNDTWVSLYSFQPLETKHVERGNDICEEFVEEGVSNENN